MDIQQRTCRISFQRHAAWTCSIDLGVQHGHTAGKCSDDMQHEIKHGHAALTWACITDIQQRNAATTRSLEISHVHGCTDLQRGEAVGCNIDMHRGHAARTCSINIRHGHTEWTYSMDMPHSHAA